MNIVTPSFGKCILLFQKYRHQDTESTVETTTSPVACKH